MSSNTDLVYEYETAPLCRKTRGDTLTTTFTWTIKDYLRRPELKGEYIWARIEAYGPDKKAKKWRLQLHPRGERGRRGSKKDNKDEECSCSSQNCHQRYEPEDERDDGLVKVSLVSLNKGPIKASYLMTILGESKRKIERLAEMTVTKFECKFCCFGGCDYMERKRLHFSPHLLPDGNLTLSFELTVY